MYRYVETEKYEGKTVRTGGVTSRSIKALRHLPKVGNLRYIKGYVYRGVHGVNHVGVLVRGEKGSIRFGGFGWGYSGEGPRGLEKLFDATGVPEFSRVAVRMANWPDFSDEGLGEHWRIDFDGDLIVTRT